MRCTGCSHRFPVDGGIPLLYWPTEWDPAKPDVTDDVRAFYEETPFPNYDDFDDVGSLMEKARRGLFARLLDEQIPFGARVLEVGCGTGQMSNFGDRFQFLDPNLRHNGTSAAKRQAWFRDQYEHPHESKHTIGEAMRWLTDAGFGFVTSIPSPALFQPLSDATRLFQPQSPGSALERFIVELGMAVTGSRQGGFFIIIGRRPPRQRQPVAHATPREAAR